jgi:hypothetical protein
MSTHYKGTSFRKMIFIVSTYFKGTFVLQENPSPFGERFIHLVKLVGFGGVFFRLRKIGLVVILQELNTADEQADHRKKHGDESADRQSQAIATDQAAKEDDGRR